MLHDHPRTYWHPEGHAEAIHRETLMSNERALVNQGQLIDAPSDVVVAALKFAGDRSRDRLASAYATWLDFMRRTFPTVMQAGGNDILAGMRAKKVGKPPDYVPLASVITI